MVSAFPGAVAVEDDAAVALTVGLQTAAQSAVAGTAESSVRALAKVVQVMPARLRRRVEALRAVTDPAPWAAPRQLVDPEALAVVAQACRDCERLDFAYTAADATPSDRRGGPPRPGPPPRR